MGMSPRRPKPSHVRSDQADGVRADDRSLPAAQAPSYAVSGAGSRGSALLRRETVVIEDSSRGLKSAIAAGLNCIVTRHPFTTSQMFPEPAGFPPVHQISDCRRDGSYIKKATANSSEKTEQTLAISASVPVRRPNPNMPATMALTRKAIEYLSMGIRGNDMASVKAPTLPFGYLWLHGVKPAHEAARWDLPRLFPSAASLLSSCDFQAPIRLRFMRPIDQSEMHCPAS